MLHCELHTLPYFVGRVRVFILGGVQVLITNGELSLNDVGLLLTLNEAKELYNALEQLIEAEHNELHHIHVSSSDYQMEISVSILEKNDIETYHKSIRELLSNPT